MLTSVCMCVRVYVCARYIHVYFADRRFMCTAMFGFGQGLYVYINTWLSICIFLATAIFMCTLDLGSGNQVSIYAYIVYQVSMCTYIVSSLCIVHKFVCMCACVCACVCMYVCILQSGLDQGSGNAQKVSRPVSRRWPLPRYLARHWIFVPGTVL